MIRSRMKERPLPPGWWCWPRTPRRIAILSRPPSLSPLPRHARAGHLFDAPASTKQFLDASKARDLIRGAPPAWAVRSPTRILKGRADVAPRCGRFYQELFGRRLLPGGSRTMAPGRPEFVNAPDRAHRCRVLGIELSPPMTPLP